LARLRKDNRGFDLMSDVLPFGRLWYTKPDDAIGYAQFYSRSHHAVIRVYDEAGNAIGRQAQNGPAIFDDQITGARVVARSCRRRGPPSFGVRAFRLQAETY